MSVVSRAFLGSLVRAVLVVKVLGSFNVLKRIFGVKLFRILNGTSLESYTAVGRDNLLQISAIWSGLRFKSVLSGQSR